MQPQLSRAELWMPGRAVTPPTEQDQVSALAALSGTTAEAKGPRLERDMLFLRLVAEAQRRGASWAQIGHALGLGDGKAAKRAVKRLARVTQRALLARGTMAP